MKANKPDTFLALSLHRLDQAHKPIHLKVTKDSYSSNPVKVLVVFWQYISDLYSAKTGFDETRASTLFSNLNLLSFSASQCTDLNLPISELEVRSAIKALNTNKHLGPDSFMAT